VRQADLFDTAGISPKSDEWYTPSWLFKSLGVAFDLDPCSPGAPPSSVPAKVHLTKVENGLTADWQGAVWLNPPFSGKRPWYERMVEHGYGIALMPARTETHALQDYMNAAQALIFLKGRIYFERGHRPGASSSDKVTCPPFGIVLCAYGEDMAIALLDSELLGVRAKVWRPSVTAGEAVSSIDWHQRTIQCPNCRGTGEIEPHWPVGPGGAHLSSYTCSRCKGNGRVLPDQTVTPKP